jgi:hypothetical protein
MWLASLQSIAAVRESMGSENDQQTSKMQTGVLASFLSAVVRDYDQKNWLTFANILANIQV